MLSWGHDEMLKNWLGREDVSEPDHAMGTGTDHDRRMLRYYEILIKKWSASGWRDDENCPNMDKTKANL